MNRTEVQNPRRKLDDKCLCLSYMFGSAHVFQKLRFADFVSNNSSSDTKVFLCFIAFSGSPKAIHRPLHALRYVLQWAYLSESLIKDSHKCLSSTTDNTVHVVHTSLSMVRRKSHTACSNHLITQYRYIHVMGKYTETLHVKKMADLVPVTLVYNTSNF